MFLLKGEEISLKQNRFRLLCLLILTCFILSACASSGIPVTENMPVATLPPAEVNFVAPIGDAALEYRDEAILYLPRHDGMTLTTVSTQVTYAPTRPQAESLVRALLAFAGNGEASAVGGSVRLSLFGANPVEVSRDVATVNLSPSALQLDREAFYVACQAITNTLTQQTPIRYVNFLVADKAVGLDIANTLPIGAMQNSSAEDLKAAYQQQLSHRNELTGEDSVEKSFASNVTLYFPLLGTDGMVSEVRSLAFEDQVFANMVVAILRELSLGPKTAEINSPTLPLLAELLSADPKLQSDGNAGGSIISLEFAHNLDDMLSAYGLTRAQSMASLCYTLCSYFPNVSGVSVSIANEPINSLQLNEDADVSISFDNNTLLRADFATLLYDYATLYLPNDDSGSLQAFQRPLPYARVHSPRALLTQLSEGPKPFDSHPNLSAVMPPFSIADKDILGIALADGTLLLNFAPTFEALGKEMNETEERLLAYAIVNTLCADPKINNVCIFSGGTQFDGFTGSIYWHGLFYPMAI